MHRLLTESAALASETPVLPKEALDHLKVLRPKDGEEIELFDGQGATRVFAYSAADRALHPTAAPIVRKPRPPALTLFACVTKGSRWDWTIEKATELGVTRIVPVLSERTIVRIEPRERAAKCARWRRIAEEAARQSDATWLPEILQPMDFAASLPLVKTCRCLVGALTEKTRFVSQATGDAIYVGPEGDFTPAELNALLAIATPVSFGESVLRAETAAIFGVSVLKALNFSASRSI